MAELIRNVEPSAVFKLADLVELELGKVNSIALAQTPGTKMSVFAIDEGEGMATHAAPGDAMVTVLEGIGEITLPDGPHELHAGESIVMPAGAPHAVKGVTPFKMLLVVVKETQ